MALCFQKLGALEECALCLEASLQSINSPFLLPKFQGDPSKKLKKLKYECKAHMQVCALLSQLHRHKEALQHAEKSVMIAQYMIQDLLQMCQHYYVKVLSAKKNEQIAQELIMMDENNQQAQNKDLIYYDDSVSMLERTAFRILPIIQEVASRMVKNPSSEDKDLNKRVDISELMKQKLNMKAVLGYLNQSEWLYLLNIGNIMQITPLTVHDLYSNTNFEIELTRDSILEKISFLAVSYFCISTELRFLVQIKDDPTIDPQRKKKESEYWHAKALEVSCSFLPSESPLVSHILTSYNKHHAPVQHGIPEDNESVLELKVVRPLPGIDTCKFQPIVRQDEALHITIPQLPLSPNTYSHRRKVSQDNKTTTQQLLSLPISPNNQGIPTANASQNHLFSSQLGNKNQQTAETTSTATNQNGASQRQTYSSITQGSNGQPQSSKVNQQVANRFSKNKNQNGFSQARGSGPFLKEENSDIQNQKEENPKNLNKGSKLSHDEITNQAKAYQKILNDFSNIQKDNLEGKMNPQILKNFSNQQINHTQTQHQSQNLNQMQKQQIMNRFESQDQDNQNYQGEESIDEEDMEVYEDKENLGDEDSDFSPEGENDFNSRSGMDNDTRNNSVIHHQSTSLNANSKHQESQEVEILMDEGRQKRKKQLMKNQVQQQQVLTQMSRPLSGGSAQRRNIKGSSKMSQNKNIMKREKHSSSKFSIQRSGNLQNQVLDISQENIQLLEEPLMNANDEIEDDEFYDNSQIINGNQSLDDLLEQRASASRSKQVMRMQNNLSVDGARIRRPQTSQGMRKGHREINHNLISNMDQNNTMRQQTLPQQAELKAIKTNSALGVIPSADGVSPNNAGEFKSQILEAKQSHNKSAAATSSFQQLQNILPSNSQSREVTRAHVWQTNIRQGYQNQISSEGHMLITPDKEKSYFLSNQIQLSEGDKMTKKIKDQNRQIQGQKQTNSKDASFGFIKSNDVELNDAQRAQFQQNRQQLLDSLKHSQATNQRIANQFGNEKSLNQLHNLSQNQQIASHFAVGLNSSLTQANSHNHSQLLIGNALQQENSRQVSQLNQKSTNQGGVSQTSQGFYKGSSQFKQQQANIQGTQPRSNSQQSRKNYSSQKNNHQQSNSNQQQVKGGNVTSVEGFFSQGSINMNSKNQIQNKFQTAQSNGSREGNQKEEERINPQKTLQDIFMIDRLAKKRPKGTGGHNTHDQSMNSGHHNQSFEQFMGLNSSMLNDSKLHNSNSRSKSRSKLTTSRSKDKHSAALQGQKMKVSNFNSHTAGTQSVLNSSALIGGQGTLTNGLSQVAISNNNTSVLSNLNGQSNQSQEQQSHIEELKRQILMKQALLVEGASSKNSRRKSTGNLNQSMQQQQLLQNNQMKKRVENANNQSMRVEGSSQNQLNSSNLQNQSGIVQFSQGNLKQGMNQQIHQAQMSQNNTQQMIKKFLKDRQSQQSTQLLSQSNSLMVNGNQSQSQMPIFQPLSSQSNSVLALNNNLNNSMVEHNYSSAQNQSSGTDISSYKMQLSKKIMAQQQKLLGVMSQQNNKQLPAAMNFNEAQAMQSQMLRQQRNGVKQQAQMSGVGVIGNSSVTQSQGAKTVAGQYVTEPHPRTQQQQQQRSATPIFEMYDMPVNGAISRTQKTINQSNSLGMYVGNQAQRQKKDKSLNDIGNINIQKSNINSRQQAQIMSNQEQLLHDQSMRDDSFSKSAKKKQSKKATPKNVLAQNSQFSWIQ